MLNHLNKLLIGTDENNLRSRVSFGKMHSRCSLDCIQGAKWILIDKTSCDFQYRSRQRNNDDAPEFCLKQGDSRISINIQRLAKSLLSSNRGTYLDSR